MSEPLTYIILISRNHQREESNAAFSKVGKKKKKNGMGFLEREMDNKRDRDAAKWGNGRKRSFPGESSSDDDKRKKKKKRRESSSDDDDRVKKKRRRQRGRSKKREKTRRRRNDVIQLQVNPHLPLPHHHHHPHCHQGKGAKGEEKNTRRNMQEK